MNVAVLEAEKAMDSTDCKMDLILPRLNSLLSKKNWNNVNVKDLFEALVKRFKWQNQQIDFKTWMAKILNTIDIQNIDPELKLGKTEDSRRNIIELVCDDHIDEENLLEILWEDRQNNLEEILEELFPTTIIREGEELSPTTIIREKVKNIVSAVDSALKNGQTKMMKDDKNGKKMENYLFELCQAVEEKQKWRPCLTQMVSWCLLALSETSHLLQVHTGEGKSCIVAMFAAYRALKGDKVDIISSSPVLAERDAKEWKPFYEQFKLKVSCNTSKSSETTLKQCYECDIVYGTTDSFAGDWLRHHFQREKVRGDRKFQCVIVDEVDSLMLDKGLEVVYLNSKIPAMLSINTVLLGIWSLVSQHKKLDRGKIAGPIQSFVQILEDISGISESDVLDILKQSEEKNIFPKGFTQDTKQLNSENVIQKLTSIDMTQIVEFFRLAETQLPNYRFILYSPIDNGKKLERTTEVREVGDRNIIHLLIFKGGLCRQLFSDKESASNFVEENIRKNLQFTGPEKTPEDSSIVGFQHLIFGKLQLWVENAFRATEMDLGDEYVAQGETVVPVDYQCTGVVQNNMRWGDGLQQFLEMKHQAKVSNMTVITNFMSNVRLFQMYGNQVFGVTGTLGNDKEIEMLNELYSGIHTSNVPPFQQRKLFEEEGQILAKEKDWLKAICRVVTEKASVSPRGGRAVLVICETINWAKAIEKEIKDSNLKVNVKSYTDNNSDASEISKKLEPSDVIIATNLAGRGTDLQVSEEVNKAGGLFVLQTFLPLNIRVEQQAFGRTGRQGNPGSAQLIMCASHFSGSVIMEIFENASSFCETAQSKLSCILDRGTAEKQLNEALIPVLTGHSDIQSWQKLTTALEHLRTHLEIAKKTITDAKQARNNIVKHKMTFYLSKDIPKMTKKEILFSLYLDLIEEIYKKHENSKMLDAIVESMHECWGLWLLMRFDENESEETLKCKFKEAMENAQDLLEKEISPSSAVSFYIRYGNKLRQITTNNGPLEKSIEIYSKALGDEDLNFIALYNRALSIMQMRRGNYVSEALRDLERAVESIMCNIKITEDAMQYVANTGPDPFTGQITVFRNQLCVRLHVYNCLKKNITEALNQLRIAHNIGGGVTVTEHHIFTLVDLHMILQQPIDVAEELANLKLLGLTGIIYLKTTFSLAGFFSKVFRRF